MSGSGPKDTPRHSPGANPTKKDTNLDPKKEERIPWTRGVNLWRISSSCLPDGSQMLPSQMFLQTLFGVSRLCNLFIP